MSEKKLKLKKRKVLVGMSGGVDSSVAALMLQKEGYEVEGAFLNFVEGEKSEKDFASAQKIAKKLNIPLHKIEAQKNFQEKIIDKFVDDYKKGITPNPCVFCNPEMKFRILLEEADKRGAEKVATGHYARVRELMDREEILNSKFEILNKIKNSKLKTGESHPLFNYPPQGGGEGNVCVGLLKAKDDSKDQSYFLYRLTQVQLVRIIFPLGDYLKSEVREIAQENNFDIKSEEESQDICFIAKDAFNEFISKRIKNNSGEIVDKNGNVLGKHIGLHFYTIGQRKGINLGGDGPYFVIKKDVTNNRLVVSNNVEADFLEDEFEMKDVNWIRDNLNFPLEVKVKVRYRSSEEYAIINKMDNETYKVKLVKKQKAITPGQSAVFYSEEEEVLGGGIIV